MFSKYIFFQSFTFTKPIKEFTEHLWYSGSDLLIVGSNPVTNGILYFKYYLGMYAVPVLSNGEGMCVKSDSLGRTLIL